MHPAYSVIFFTVSSGIGYGLLALMGGLAAVGLLPMDKSLGATGLGIGFVAVSAGLLSSTFHLGRPERAWRAMTQWRTSWLSREGVVAVATFLPMLLLAYCWFYPGSETRTLEIWALLTAIGAAATVFCTGKIYQSLKTIHQWHNVWTVPNYLLLGLAGGAVWLLAISGALGIEVAYLVWFTVMSIVAAWFGKIFYWQFIDNSSHEATPESATGLGRFGQVSKFEAPHTSANYLLKEMGYFIARKHAGQLRGYAQALGFIVPLLFIFGGVFAGHAIPFLLAAISMTLGLVIERWLFFAEAKHVVVLYYGSNSA